jgi:hypothetical protein
VKNQIQESAEASKLTAIAGVIIALIVDLKQDGALVNY